MPGFMRQNAHIQRSGSAGPAKAPPIVRQVLRTPGQPLDAATRAFMEPRFGHDFSRVRVHSDGEAAESARAVSAVAYTVGNHVVLGDASATSSVIGGQWLLAHELAHVVQQQGVAASASQDLPVSSPHDVAERKADATAARVLSGERGAPTATSDTPQVQRVTPGGIPAVTSVGWREPLTGYEMPYFDIKPPTTSATSTETVAAGTRLVQRLLQQVGQELWRIWRQLDSAPGRER